MCMTPSHQKLNIFDTSCEIILHIPAINIAVSVSIGNGGLISSAANTTQVNKHFYIVCLRMVDIKVLTV